MRLISLPDDTLSTCSSSNISVPARACKTRSGSNDAYKRPMRVAPIVPFGHAPAQIEHAAAVKDGQEPLDGRGHIIRREVHDDGLAKHVCEAPVCNHRKLRQRSCLKRNMRIPLPGLTQQTFRSVESLGGIAVPVEPSRIPATTAPDVCCDPSWDEEPLHRGVEVGRRRLRFPILGKDAGVAVVCFEGCLVHRSRSLRAAFRAYRRKSGTAPYPYAEEGVCVNQEFCTSLFRRRGPGRPSPSRSSQTSFRIPVCGLS